ncbi:hotdog family protein [Chitinasiproducens palmae]|uniref:3-methylfumaryl-CoA hydratase/itaconyl-CoA hydratase / mesaconyl-C4 CoA hydratase n=1 Tax=Chitinasiproducens palmae TaxID=1770053 RepID=A0A1H2PPW1_9BURK|nr:hypothetical protein [Chitinasiproducens palmae]SDV48734.1 3-methylfumaryl-CoA hydratase/itaconyl-CoA hydratase / mesaconyl-C4 CoA hydratase [Chitinasiproducens palmae]
MDTTLPHDEPPRIGQPLPACDRRADTVQLFLYNAAIWNPHRIHYDLPYTEREEGHPGLLIDGPLQGDWLLQAVYETMREQDTLLAFRFSNRRPAYVGETLRIEGEVASIDGAIIAYSLRARNAEGLPTTVGEATVRRG